MYTIQARKKYSKAWSVLEIPQDVIPELLSVTKSENLHEERDKIIYYMSSIDLPGASRIVAILKKYERVQLKRY